MSFPEEASLYLWEALHTWLCARLRNAYTLLGFFLSVRQDTAKCIPNKQICFFVFLFLNLFFCFVLFFVFCFVFVFLSFLFLFFLFLFLFLISIEMIAYLGIFYITMTSDDFSFLCNCELLKNC